MHQSFCCALSYEDGRRALCELSVSVQLESTQEKNAAFQNRYIQNCKANATKKECENLKRFGFVLQLSKWMQLNWKFPKLVWIRQAPIWIISQTKQLSAIRWKRKAKQDEKNYTSRCTFTKFSFCILCHFLRAQFRFAVAVVVIVVIFKFERIRLTGIYTWK